MNDLEVFFNNNKGRVLHKWHHYFDVYDRHFSKYRGQEIVILEIGLFHGGSLSMWKDYFGPKAKIYGIDINPNCKQLEGDNVEVFIGSQSDRKFLREVKSKMPKIDILIDDGGHTMRQQIITFEELFDQVKSDGVYLCEDIHTSYWLSYGGGYKRMGTFIEYSKNFIDQINAFHSTQSSLKVNSFTQSVDSLHFYDSIVVIEKKPRTAPVVSMTGSIEIEQDHPKADFKKTLNKARFYSLYAINYALRLLRLPSIIW